MTDEQKMRELEDAIAGYRHTVASLRARLTELENLVGKLHAPASGKNLTETSQTFVAVVSQGS
jgi:hypothetical protein